jgi:hypothetical protein
MAPADQQADANLETTVSGAASLLGVSRHTVYRLIGEGVLGCRNVGLPWSRRPSYRVLVDEVRRLRQPYERHTHGPATSGQRKATKRVSTAELEFIRMS